MAHGVDNQQPLISALFLTCQILRIFRVYQISEVATVIKNHVQSLAIRKY